MARHEPRRDLFHIYEFGLVECATNKLQAPHCCLCIVPSYDSNCNDGKRHEGFGRADLAVGKLLISHSVFSLLRFHRPSWRCVFIMYVCWKTFLYLHLVFQKLQHAQDLMCYLIYLLIIFISSRSYLIPQRTNVQLLFTYYNLLF